jgi:C1A family cysteine protease
MSDVIEKVGMGWVRDYPDFRDLTEETTTVSSKLKSLGQDSVAAMLAKTGVAKSGKSAKSGKVSLPASMDLRAWCPPIEDQGSLGSCTAQAGVGIVEYFERRAFGRHIDASRLFLYKATRDLLHWTGDTGAYLRTTMGALVLFGVPPEEYWPYNTAPTDFDKEPSAFCYAYAQNYQAISYFRHDPPGTPTNILLSRIKTYLSNGLPSMFGFTVYDSIREAATTGKISYPVPGARVVGGHAIVAVGYDDAMKISRMGPFGPVETTGAFLIRNSWGTGWGGPMAGYGWLPYEYVVKGLAVDWWSCLKNEWVETRNF